MDKLEFDIILEIRYDMISFILNLLTVFDIFIIFYIYLQLQLSKWLKKKSIWM